MAFVKLKKSILNSTVWMDRDVRDVWITALLMADLHELREPTPTIRVASLQRDPFVVPAGWYGFVPAASTGIIRMAGMPTKAGMKALQTLASPDPESRTPDHGGRRLVRVDGGFIVLTYDKHRQKDETAAERMRRYRDRTRAPVTPSQRVTDRNVTHLDQDQDQEGDQDQDQRHADQTRARASGPPTNGAGKVWDAGTWLRKYGAAWVEKYGTAAYGMQGDAKACAGLRDVLAELPEAERAAAQAKAPEMFAEFLARGGTAADRRHPFAFFVQEWGGLRVPAAPSSGRLPRSAGNVEVLKTWLAKGQS